MPIRKHSGYATEAVRPGLLYCRLAMPRFFTLVEAKLLLPEVEGLLRSLIQLKTEYERAGGELESLLQRIAVMGGTIPPRDKIGQLRDRKEAVKRGLESSFGKLHETGCQVKDVEIGLLDFPTLYHRREVYLCWRLGEESIAFWHEIEDGFRGRRPIDSEFLANHSSQ